MEGAQLGLLGVSTQGSAHWLWFRVTADACCCKRVHSVGQKVGEGSQGKYPRQVPGQDMGYARMEPILGE